MGWVGAIGPLIKSPRLKLTHTNHFLLTLNYKSQGGQKNFAVLNSGDMALLCYEKAAVLPPVKLHE